MALSSDLISQFGKLMKTEKDANTETTVYGTVVKYNNKTYVRLDGSDLLTPVATTTALKDGERVIVRIKNHTATVTGNISSPSASNNTVEQIGAKTEETSSKITDVEILIADKVSTDDFDAQVARIDSLQADNVVIKDLLLAGDADIGDLTANYADISKRLTAAEADIDDLEATKLDVEVADITYATIADLEATNVNLHNLKSTYADFEVATVNRFTAVDTTIKNLDSKYATISDLNVERGRIDDLEATSLTASSAVIADLQADVADIDALIAQLGNAQIKSAMIESISADKIISGDIITNNVRVMSEDGKLLISDETIQISDATRVRVQIGKDLAGDYSINIWDTAGKLMFSEGGITDSAIKNAIIRDDMVSDTANISAHKLNIDTLFEVINGSTKTIKSSKILVDSEGQKLDVVFSDLSTRVDGLDETVSSQGTSLSLVQGQIGSKVWQADIDDATGEMNTKYSTLEQEVDEMNIVIASHTTGLDDKAENSMVNTVIDQVTELEADLTGFKSIVSDTYATKTEMTEAQTHITQNSESIAAISERTTVNESAISLLELTSDSLIARVSSTEKDTETALKNADSAQETADKAESLIKQISDNIAMLVTDGNGTSLMTQTDDGWMFSTAELQKIVDATSEGLDSLVNELGSTNSAIDILQQTVGDLGVLSDYVKIGTYESEPCIELGESDSDFKLIITNTRIMFMEGSSVPAYINNQSLFIKNAVIEEELQQGEFIWKARSNGNLGLIWKGATS